MTQWLEGRRSTYPSYTNRASQIGHPCTRKLVYARTAWQYASKPSIKLQGILEFGTDYEQALIRRMMEAGYKFRQPSRPQEWAAYNITGTDDGEVSWDGGKTYHLIEIKGLHPNWYPRVNHWRDFLELGPIYSKYPAQLQIYMLFLGIEKSYFLIGRKGSYDINFLPVELDYKLAETYIAKAEEINRHIAAKTLPDQINDWDICEMCEYRMHCLPDVFTAPAALEKNTPMFLDILKLREDGADDKSRMDKAHKTLSERAKKIMGNTDRAVVGPFLVTHKENKTGSRVLRVKRVGVDPVEEEPEAEATT